jgi:purine-cytosine permease-like protein
MWIAITLEEEFIFRRWARPQFSWSEWNNQEKLPIGLAAFAAFCVGWVGSVLCMAQFYFIGPLAKLVGDYGGDMGNFVGFAWAALIYPPLRYLELKKFGR